MTTQSAISGQSFGTSTNIGEGKFSITPLTLADITTAYVVNVQVTNGAGITGLDGNPQTLRVWYTTTMRTVTAANAPVQLRQTAHYVDILCRGKTAEVQIRDSMLEPKTGAKFHCWVDAPSLTNAATLDVDVVEVPS